MDKKQQINEIKSLIAKTIKQYLQEEGCATLFVRGRENGTLTKIISEALYNADYRKCETLNCEKLINNFITEIRVNFAEEIIKKVKTMQEERIVDEAIIGLLLAGLQYETLKTGYTGRIYAETPNPAKHFKPICPYPHKIVPYNTVCPVCGKETDGTEHGRQYCYDCKEKLEEKK